MNENTVWNVVVYVNGEDVLRIGHNSTSGKDLSEEEEDAVRLAAEHLRSFIGEKKITPFQTCVDCDSKMAVHLEVCPNCGGEPIPF